MNSWKKKMKTKATLLLFILFPLYGFRFTNISRFVYVNSLFRYGLNLYVGTEGGVLVYNTVSHSIDATLVTERPVELAIYDPFTAKVYFVSAGALYAWNPYTKIVSYMLNTGLLSSLGVDEKSIYLEVKGGGIRKCSKTGVFEGGAKLSSHIFWTGERAYLKRNDMQLVSLSPYQVYSEGMGSVDMRIFYPEMNLLWIGTDGLGVYKYDLQMHMFLDSIRVGLAGMKVFSLYRSGDTLWMGTDRGFTILYGGEWSSFTRNGLFELRGEKIVDITGGGGEIWLATEEGLARYKEGDIDFYSLPVRVGEIFSIYWVPECIYIGTDEGVAKLEKLRGTLEIILEGRGEVRDISSLRKKVYFVSEDGLLVYKEGEWFKVEDPSGWLLFGVCNVTNFDDSLFILTSRGIVVYDGSGKFQYIETPVNFDRNSTHSLRVFRDRIYIAAEDGLYVMDKGAGTWMTLRESDGLPSNDVYDVTNFDGALYIATARGISIFEW